MSTAPVDPVTPTTPPTPEPDESRVVRVRVRDLTARDWAAAVVRAVRAVMRDQLPDRAATLAYYAFLAIPAVLLLALGVIGVVYTPADVQTELAKLDGVLPPEAITLLNENLATVAAGTSGGVTLILVAVPLALWSATGAMNALMRALSVVYGREERRGFVRQRLTALVMLGWSLAALAMVVALLILGPQISDWLAAALDSETVVPLLWSMARWPILLGGLFVSFAGILYLGPDVRHPRWQVLSAGAVVATVTWLGISAGFAWYAGRFASYNAAWGSLSVVVVTLVWLWLSGLALLLGAEMNAELERGREMREGVPPEAGIVAEHR